MSQFNPSEKKEQISLNFKGVCMACGNKAQTLTQGREMLRSKYLIRQVHDRTLACWRVTGPISSPFLMSSPRLPWFPVLFF